VTAATAGNLFRVFSYVRDFSVSLLSRADI